MPRARKSRLLPSLATVAEEALLEVGDFVRHCVASHASEVLSEIQSLRREVEQLRRQLVEPRGGGRVGRPRSSRTCSVKECAQPHVARGLCKNHYQKMRYVEKKTDAKLAPRGHLTDPVTTTEEVPPPSSFDNTL